MSAHTFTLPGEVTRPSYPYCLKCEAYITDIHRGDTPRKWHRALEDEQATRDYLEKYNSTVTHADDCEYANLPPSVHIDCWRRPDPSKAYEEELKKLLRKGYDLG
jgi:hypothetical protein